MYTFYITGATGHLGRNVVLKLLNRDDVDYIVCLVLENDNYIPFIDPNNKIKYVKGDVLNKDSLDYFLSNYKSEKNIVIHSAGLISIYKKKDEKVMNVNVNGTKNILDSSLKNKIDRFIYISSVDAIKKDKKGEVVEPKDFNPSYVEGIYGKSKAIATNLVLSYNNLGLETISIHPSALFGPNDYYKGPINTALTKFYNDKLKVIVTGGYDIVDARDIAEGIISASIKGKGNNSYILSGYKLKIKELINISAKVLNKKSYRICLSAKFVKIFAPLLEFISKRKHKKPLFTAYSMDCLHQNYNYSSKKAEQELDFKLTPLEDSLKDTFEWIKKREWK